MAGDPREVQIRPRTPADVLVLAEALMAQQPDTGYPMRNPLPFPPEEFVARPYDLMAWVAEVDRRPAGHVAVTRVGDDDLGRSFADSTGMLIDRLGCVSTLFVGRGHGGLGLGGRLHDAAVAWCREQALLPVLEIFPSHAAAHRLYLRRGWQELGTLRPEWVPDGAPDIVLMMLPESA